MGFHVSLGEFTWTLLCNSSLGFGRAFGLGLLLGLPRGTTLEDLGTVVQGSKRLELKPLNPKLGLGSRLPHFMA